MKKKAKRKITIRDVADLVGVHHSTVSRALSPQERSKISPTVVRRVEKAAEKLGYNRNIMASSLKHNQSFAIGVLVPDLTNPIFPPIIRGIQDIAESAGYTVITANTDDEKDKERSALRMMMGRSIDGIILSAARRSDPIVEECIDNEIPIVLVNRTVDRDGVNAIVGDEEYGIRSALDHLTDLGHKNIAHIAGPLDTSTGFERCEAFTNYLRSRGLDDSRIEQAEKFTVAEGYRAFKALFKSSSDFTAVMASNDLIALGCIDAMQEMGLTAPKDISIVGHNDMPFLSRMTPALTTVVVPKYEMGAQGAKTLLEIFKDERSESLILRLRPKLVIRKSTAAPAS